MPILLALVHTTYGQAGVMSTTAVANARHEWTSSFVDTRKYVPSCGCRKRKRAICHATAMRPAQFSLPYEVLEMDMSDIKRVITAGNRRLLFVANGATKFLFTFSLAAKVTEPITKCLLMLFLTFRIPYFLKSDTAGESASEVVHHVCQWMKVNLDHGPVGHPRGRDAWKDTGGGYTTP